MSNVGARAGSTVLQFYLRDHEASVSRPEKELKAFVKCHLSPGETRAVTASFDMRALAFFDVSTKSSLAEMGQFTILAGLSSRRHCRERGIRTDRELDRQFPPARGSNVGAGPEPANGASRCAGGKGNPVRFTDREHENKAAQRALTEERQVYLTQAVSLPSQQTPFIMPN